jgi:translation initiation factor IF-2
LPEFGEAFVGVKNEKQARALASENALNHTEKSRRTDMSSHELIKLINRKTTQQELNIIVKADVQGSLTSVIDSLKTLDTEEVAVRVVGSGVGSITENDIRMAASSNAIIYGFQVDMPSNIKQLASRDKVRVRLYKIIYELIDDAKTEMSDKLEDEEIITNAGRLIVRGIFKTTKTECICGGEVTKGKLVIPGFVSIFRGEEEIAKELPVVNLKHGPTDTKEVLEGEMCGMSLETKSRLDLVEGDRIELFTREVRERSL